MSVERYGGKIPEVHSEAFVHPLAVVIGDVKIGRGSSVWPGAVLRGDIAPIRVGENSNIQDGCILHNAEGGFVVIGDRCTIGHGAVLHGCRIESECLIGIRAIVLDDALVGAGSIVAAGALVTAASIVHPGSVMMGAPASWVRRCGARDAERIETGWRVYEGKILERLSAG